MPEIQWSGIRWIGLLRHIKAVHGIRLTNQQVTILFHTREIAEGNGHTLNSMARAGLLDQSYQITDLGKRVRKTMWDYSAPDAKVLE